MKRGGGGAGERRRRRKRSRRSKRRKRWIGRWREVGLRGGGGGEEKLFPLTQPKNECAAIPCAVVVVVDFVAVIA